VSDHLGVVYGGEDRAEQGRAGGCVYNSAAAENQAEQQDGPGESRPNPRPARCRTHHTHVDPPVLDRVSGAILIPTAGAKYCDGPASCDLPSYAGTSND
jgi:hypothetical protein